MKNRTLKNHPNPEVNVCWIACDVGQKTLNYYTEIAGVIHEEYNSKNNTIEIEQSLNKFRLKAKIRGYDGCQIVAESTGRYHENLFRTAIRLGMETAYVNTEAAAKMRFIETNDNNKTDKKDPKVIYRLASIGKLIKHRLLSKHYSWLRELHRTYISAEEHVVETKCEIHTLLTVLFPDFNFKSDFIYGNSGRALFIKFCGSPYRIIAKGKLKFCEEMRKMVPRIREDSIQRLYECAEASHRQNLDNMEVAILEQRMRNLWEDYDRYSKIKKATKGEMEKIYVDLRTIEPKLPKAEKGFISNFHISRIISETGPLSNFNSWQQLYRYSGINLQERQSGKFRGKTKLCKKGRTHLRKIIGHIVLPLVKKNSIYGPYYHSKKGENAEGAKAMAMVMRKFIKAFFGWYQSGLKFDRQRVFQCQSQFEAEI